MLIKLCDISPPAPAWDLQLQKKTSVRGVTTLKTVLCGGSLGQDPVVLLGSPDTSLSIKTQIICCHTTSPPQVWPEACSPSRKHFIHPIGQLLCG